ncbi:hypothetical protein Tco_0796845 [Tanacetum coccineum]
MHLTKRITIDYLRGKPVHLGVVKKKGKEHERLLIPSDDDDSSRKQVTAPRRVGISKYFEMASISIGGNGQSKNYCNALKWTDSTQMAPDYGFSMRYGYI